MTRFELLKQLDVAFVSEMMFQIVHYCKNQEELCDYLNEKISEKELRQIDEAALKEGRQPVFFSFKQ